MFGDKFVVLRSGANYTKRSTKRGKPNYYKEGEVVVAVDNSHVPFTLPVAIFNKYKPRDLDEATSVAKQLGIWPWSLIIERHLGKL